MLVCPDCQATADWKSELDTCQHCGGVRLVRRLGEVECRECGFVVAPDEPGCELSPGGAAGSGVRAGAEGAAGPRRAGLAHAAGSAGGRAPGLAEEVAHALERVLGRAGRPPARAGLPGQGPAASRCARPPGPQPGCSQSVGPQRGGTAGVCVWGR